MARVNINQELCKGCGLCVDACPLQLLALAEEKINSKGYHPAECTDLDRCTGCASCARMCPDVVIEVER
nr:4Fe-4S binding protein [Maliibacterium massiliense]